MTEKQSKIGRKSRNKGKSFERKMAIKHREWMPGTNWQTTRNSGRTDLPGDIFDMDGETIVLSECKHRQTWNVRGLTLGNTSYRNNRQEVIDGWAKVQKRYPILMIWAQNEFGLWLNTVTYDKCHDFRINDLWEIKAVLHGNGGIIWHLIGEPIGSPEEFKSVFYG